MSTVCGEGWERDKRGGCSGDEMGQTVLGRVTAPDRSVTKRHRFKQVAT